MVVALLGTRPATRPPALLTALVLLLVAADAIRLGVAQLRASASPPTGDKHQIRKLFKAARLHIRRNQLDEARPLLRRCLQIDGADAHSWLALATLEERSGDVERGACTRRRTRCARRTCGCSTRRACSRRGTARRRRRASSSRAPRRSTPARRTSRTRGGSSSAGWATRPRQWASTAARSTRNPTPKCARRRRHSRRRRAT